MTAAFAELGVVEGRTLTPSSVQGAGGEPSHKVVKYPYIDALRGYAVLLVILSHTGGMFPELPYPIKKLTNLGWTGVQLFFLVSCVTLMMSWRSDQRKGIASPFRFGIRRFFRIAPMYYLAAIFYFVVEPPAGGFDPLQMLATLTFVNSWHPALLSTLDGGWRVVPGGWSISVEFCFYALFPLIVAYALTPRRAVIFTLGSVVIACVANDAVRGHLSSQYGQTATDTFLYYWLPNQLFVFALGTLLFFIIDAINKKGLPRWMTWQPLLWVAVCIGAIVLLGENPHFAPGIWSLQPFRGPPFVFYVSLLLIVFAVLIAGNPKSILVNKAIRALGTVSFSAYIFHFFVVHQLADLPFFAARQQTGVKAIFICGILFVLTVLVTFGISKLSYRFVEKPMIKRGARLAAFGRKPAED